MAAHTKEPLTVRVGLDYVDISTDREDWVKQGHDRTVARGTRQDVVAITALVEAYEGCRLAGIKKPAAIPEAVSTFERIADTLQANDSINEGQTIKGVRHMLKQARKALAFLKGSK